MAVFRWLRHAGAGCAVLLAAASANAASVPSTVAPGAIERSLPAKPPERPTALPDVGVPPPPPIAAPQGADAIRFPLKGVVVDGATALSQDALSVTYRDYVGHEVTLADLYAIANAITHAYTEAGYALSFAVVPAQRINDGIAHIRVIEGFVAKISYEDKNVAVPAIIGSGYADKILHSRPLRTADLERYLLLANDVPGYTVRAVFTKSTDPDAPIGATELILKVEHRGFGAGIQVDNGAARAFGSWRADAAITAHSPFGLGEDVGIRVLRSLADASLGYYALSGSASVDAEGTRLDLLGSYSTSRPNVSSLGPNVFAGTTWIGAVGLTHPAIRSRAENLTLSGTLTGKVLNGNILGVPNSRDRLYVATLGTSYSTVDEDSQTSIQATLNQGLPIFGATTSQSPLRSRQSGSGSYTAVLLDITRIQHLIGPFEASLSLHGQAASRPLLSSEQCGFGGAQYGRAFDDSELLGDQCAMAAAEVRLPVRAALGINSPALDGLEVFGFCDGGAVWLKGPLLAGEHRTMNAQSCGGAISWASAFGATASLAYARSVLHNSVSGRDRLLLTLRFGV